MWIIAFGALIIGFNFRPWKFTPEEPSIVDKEEWEWRSKHKVLSKFFLKGKKR